MKLHVNRTKILQRTANSYEKTIEKREEIVENHEHCLCCLRNQTSQSNWWL